MQYGVCEVVLVPQKQLNTLPAYTSCGHSSLSEDFSNIPILTPIFGQFSSSILILVFIIVHTADVTETQLLHKIHLELQLSFSLPSLPLGIRIEDDHSIVHGQLQEPPEHFLRPLRGFSHHGVVLGHLSINQSMKNYRLGKR